MISITFVINDRTNRNIKINIHPGKDGRSRRETRLFRIEVAETGLTPEETEGVVRILLRLIGKWETAIGNRFDSRTFFSPPPRGTVQPGIQARSPEDYVTSSNFPHTSDKLFHLQIGVTYACQCRCRHCAVSGQSRKGLLLTVEEIVDLCRQGREDMDARVVELFGGEPLVRRDIDEIVKGCSKYLDVWMSTNGIGFTRQKAARLKSLGLKRCFFSLDSCVPEKHDLNRRTPGCFEAVMKALEYCEEEGIEANFSTCAMADLVMSGELEDLIEFTKKSKAHRIRLVLPKMMGRFHLNESILLKRREIEKIRKITAKEESVYVEAEGNYASRIEKCFCLRGHVYINPYGVVQPCVYTTMDYGNIRDYPLKYLYGRMFNHEVFKDKSILNLCLLQNPSFVKKYLSDVSPEKPLAPVSFKNTPGLARTPEPIELMDDDKRLEIYSSSSLEGPFLAFIQAFRKYSAGLAVNGNVLDLGCGLGEVTLPFAEAFQSCRIDALDGAAKMIEHAKSNLPSSLAKRVTFIKRHLPKDRLPKNKYSIIISNSFLHHLPEPAILWDAVKACAAPGAFVFMMDLVRPGTRAEAKSLMEAYSRDLHPLIKEDFFNSLLAAYRTDEIRRQLESAGLSRLRVTMFSDIQQIVHGRMP